MNICTQLNSSQPVLTSTLLTDSLLAGDVSTGISSVAGTVLSEPLSVSTEGKGVMGAVREVSSQQIL